MNPGSLDSLELLLHLDHLMSTDDLRPVATSFPTILVEDEQGEDGNCEHYEHAENGVLLVEIQHCQVDASFLLAGVVDLDLDGRGWFCRLVTHLQATEICGFRVSRQKYPTGWGWGGEDSGVLGLLWVLYRRCQHPYTVPLFLKAYFLSSGRRRG